MKNSATSSPGGGFGHTEGCLAACSTTTRRRAEIIRKACTKAEKILVPDFDNFFLVVAIAPYNLWKIVTSNVN